MLRAITHAAMLWPAGRVPFGPQAYHWVTCGLLGSQAFHPPKLARAWARYAELMVDPCGLEVEGARVWVHECGWTPFSALAGYLLTGRGVVLSNGHARVLDRYVPDALDAAHAMPLPAGSEPRRRHHELAALRSHRSARALVAATGGTILDGVDPCAVPLPPGSIDFCHTGNALEHYDPRTLHGFLVECFRILRPGGVASHVIDHRDHLHHVDRRWPPLAHLAVPEGAYRWLFGHPLLYHNRLSPTDTMALFEAAGFERIAVRRATFGHRYADDGEVSQGAPGLPARAGLRAGSRWSALDLRTAYAHYLYRKPGAIA